MELPGWSSNCQLFHVNNGRLNIGAVLLSVVSRALAIDQFAEIALRSLMAPILSNRNQSAAVENSGPLHNTSTTNASSSPVILPVSTTAEQNVSENLLNFAPVFTNHLSRSHLLESQDFSYSKSSSTLANHQDGLSHLFTPLICAAVSLLIFGIILFVKKVALSETTQPFSFDVCDDENVVLNGDDVMYSVEYLDELEVENEACQCVTITETLEFGKPNACSSDSGTNRYI
ncbi:hypothetical protein RvY_17601-1 [Ramazzottius varieornatus]|uniref:Uncharacterized protein n=1 Tax=Ramazzottius varieornatus TaxID=947166 RepID=A0A1D1W3F3_RAMVA|nr:hypothetical protein RvY_17601-1 [Ramazzottius varieornatus]